MLQVLLLSDRAREPVRGSPLSAGLDLFSAEQVVIKPAGRCVVNTDIAVGIPDGSYGRIAPRSGLAVKHGIDVGAGVIDRDYRGSVGVVLFNHSDKPFKVNVGDKIAQLILEKVLYSNVLIVDKLSETDRGSNGFGSTGK